VRDRQLPGRGLADAEGRKCLWVEDDRQGSLGHRQELIAQAREVDVGIVADRGRRERSHDPLKQGAAWVGSELGVDDAVLLASRAVGAALQEAVGVGHRSA
jgi:hypothetical protein